jgi:hypothetical protein
MSMNIELKFSEYTKIEFKAMRRFLDGDKSLDVSLMLSNLSEWWVHSSICNSRIKQTTVDFSSLTHNSGVNFSLQKLISRHP